MASLLFVKSSCFHLRESCYTKFITGKTFPHCPIILFNYFFKNKSGEAGDYVTCWLLCMTLVHNYILPSVYSNTST